MSESKFVRLTAAIDDEIARFDRESTKHKKLFRFLKYWALGLTAIGTLLASANLVVPDSAVIHNWLNFLIVGATAGAGIVATVEGIRKPSELWMIERNIYHSLRDLKRELDYYGEERVTDQQLDDAFNRLQGTLYSSRQKWSKNIRDQSQMLGDKKGGAVAP